MLKLLKFHPHRFWLVTVPVLAFRVTRWAIRRKRAKRAKEG